MAIRVGNLLRLLDLLRLMRGLFETRICHLGLVDFHAFDFDGDLARFWTCIVLSRDLQDRLRGVCIGLLTLELLERREGR